MIRDDIRELVLESEREVEEEFKKIEETCFNNSLRVLKAFQKNKISEYHFNSTTGYGYNDIGRDAIEDVFSDVLGAEDSLVRGQFISGSHAINVLFFALLRPNDTLLSITGKPYDTLEEVIGIKPNNSSLMSFGIKYDEIDLVNDDFDYEKIRKYLKKKSPKVVAIQRSKGYATRKSLILEKLEKVIKLIREIDNNTIIMVDNCYCEFVEDKSPLEVGANVIVGSLIKNLGGGIAPNGAYIAGRKDLVYLASERLTLPKEAKEVGPSLGINKLFLQGLFMAPNAVASALKTAVLTAKVMEKLGYEVEPKYSDKRCDIVQNIIFNDKDKLIKYCQGIQQGSAIDSNVIPEPAPMPGYQDDVIMAAGSFIQGSTIELSCDGPLREPYSAYQQGSLTYEYGKIAIMEAISRLIS